MRLSITHRPVATPVAASRPRPRAGSRVAFILAALLAGVPASPGAAAGSAASASTFKWGWDLRSRDEYFNNLLTLDRSAPYNEQNYQRYRARGWAAVSLADNLVLNGRLTWESWDYNRPSNKSGHPVGWAWSEGVVDTLNLAWRRGGAVPVDLVVGRQDMVLGDGWLVFDGTPCDGSRTNFFDAARATFKFTAARTTLDLLYLDTEPMLDDRIRPFNSQHGATTEQSERTGIVYLSSTAVAQTVLDGYLIYRDQTRVLANGDNASTTTAGGRIVRDLDTHWQAKAEGALEFGRRNDRDFEAWGFVGQLNWFARDAAKNQFRLVTEVLSGDDPTTSDDEQFDIAWGRYPRWSEVFSTFYSAETRVAQYGNLLRLGAGWTTNLARPLELALDYNAVWALENNRSSALFSADGRWRGHLVRSVLSYKHSSHVSARLLGEVLFPGNYTVAARRDTASFIRTELMLAF